MQRILFKFHIVCYRHIPLWGFLLGMWEAFGPSATLSNYDQAAHRLTRLGSRRSPLLLMLERKKLHGARIIYRLADRPTADREGESAAECLHPIAAIHINIHFPARENSAPIEKIGIQLPTIPRPPGVFPVLRFPPSRARIPAATIKYLSWPWRGLCTTLPRRHRC